jgi:hypothetical protein
MASNRATCPSSEKLAQLKSHEGNLSQSAAPQDQGARLDRARLSAVALVVRHEASIRAVAAASLAKVSMTGREARQIFSRASWPSAALAMIAG